MAGKYSVIVTIIKSISIYFITSCCKKWAFFQCFSAYLCPHRVPFGPLVFCLHGRVFWFLFCGFFGGKKPTLI